MSAHNNSDHAEKGTTPWGFIVVGIAIIFAVALYFGLTNRPTAEPTNFPNAAGIEAAAKTPAPDPAPAPQPVVAQAGVFTLEQNHPSTRNQPCRATIMICFEFTDGFDEQLARTYVMFVGQRRDGVDVPVPANLNWQHGNGRPPEAGSNPLPGGGTMTWWPNSAYTASAAPQAAAQ